MEKEVFLKLIDENKTQREIGSELKIGQTTVRYWLKKFNIKTNFNINKVINGFKKCTKCNLNKPIDDFYKRENKKHYASKCKKCANLYYRKRIKDVKIKMIEYKGCKCERCGLHLKDSHYSVFDFHHINPKEKDVNFDKIKYQKWEKIKKEIDKCMLVCSNCHRLIHAEIIENKMSKIEKKKQKLRERIKTLQDEMTLALTKKTSTTKEISVPTYQRQIAELQAQLQKM